MGWVGAWGWGGTVFGCALPVTDCRSFSSVLGSALVLGKAAPPIFDGLDLFSVPRPTPLWHR
jgi:hypothetical protein